MEKSIAMRAYLGSYGWLAATPPDFKENLLSRCTPRAYPAGAVVYRLGDEPDGLYGVVSGAFAFEMAVQEQGPHRAHFFRPAAWFGESCLADGHPRLGTVVATRASECLHLPLSDLEALASADARTWRCLNVLAALRLRLALGAIEDLTIRAPGVRITAILLRLAGVRTVDNGEEAAPELDLTQTELAQIANVSRSTAGACLDELETGGLVACAYGRITLLDPPRLRARLASLDRD